MIIGIGCDICPVGRMAKALERPGLEERVFTPREAAYCRSRGTGADASFAARFAAKEALLKALGTGLRDCSLQEAEVTNDGLGKPSFLLKGRIADRVKKAGGTTVHLSLAHSGEAAIAYVIIEGTWQECES